MMTKREPIIKKVYVSEIIDYQDPDLCYLPETGDFKYNGYILDGISIDNQAGKALKIIALNTIDRYITDTDLQRITNSGVKKDWAYVIRNLKNALKKNGLDAKFDKITWKDRYHLKQIVELDDRYKQYRA